MVNKETGMATPTDIDRDAPIIAHHEMRPAAGITRVHEWLFEEAGDGVRVTTNESFAAGPPRARARSLPREAAASRPSLRIATDPISTS
jgi:hypothetical protein